jgi:hypothetical protein
MKAKNGFQPSFWSRGQNSFSKSESPPWVGVVRWAMCLQSLGLPGPSPPACLARSLGRGRTRKSRDLRRGRILGKLPP